MVQLIKKLLLQRCTDKNANVLDVGRRYSRQSMLSACSCLAVSVRLMTMQIHSDSKQTRSFLALLFAASDFRKIKGT